MKVAIEQIRDTEVDNLSVSWDEEDGFMMLFTPYMDDKMNHFHIELSTEQAAKLKEFLEVNYEGQK